MMNEQRSFIIGDEWIYFKIYSGYKTADIILTHTIFPLAQDFLQRKLIDYWFFIRYSDPQFHIRVRFHVSEKENITSIIHHFNNSIRYYIDNDFVWKVQTDTYQRELERYSIELIEYSEQLFSLSSEMICKLITLDEVRVDESLRWLFGLKMIDTLLTDFEYSLQNKINLFNKLQETYGKEFGITTDFRRQFGQKYRTEKNRIEKFLDKTKEQDDEHITLFNLIFENSKKSEEIIKKIRNKITEDDIKSSFSLTYRVLFESLDDLLSSYIHMALNRLFRTQQNIHELVLYDYLFRYYSSLAERQKAESRKERADA